MRCGEYGAYGCLLGLVYVCGGGGTIIISNGIETVCHQKKIRQMT